MEDQLPALFVIAVPIGNYDDITLRAKELLASCEIIICEDTRKTGQLLKHLTIENKKISFPRNSSPVELDSFVENLKQYKKIALVSDHGTPAISDPGSRLVSVCRDKNFQVQAVPGVSAVITALSICGFQTNPFLFAGFLPPHGAKRQKALENYCELEGLIVIYESVHRIEDLMKRIFTLFSDDVEVFIARELTKIHETCFICHNYEEFLEKVVQKKGEFVIVLNNSKKSRRKREKLVKKKWEKK